MYERRARGDNDMCVEAQGLLAGHLNICVQTQV